MTNLVVTSLVLTVNKHRYYNWRVPPSDRRSATSWPSRSRSLSDYQVAGDLRSSRDCPIQVQILFVVALVTQPINYRIHIQSSFVMTNTSLMKNTNEKMMDIQNVNIKTVKIFENFEKKSASICKYAVSHRPRHHYGTLRRRPQPVAGF